MDDATTAMVDKWAHAVADVAPKAWQAMIHGTRVEAMAGIASTGLAWVVFGLALYLGIRFGEWSERDGSPNNWPAIMAVVAGCLLVITAGVTALSITGYAVALLSPEYVVIQKIMEAAQ
jgi:hypothetical protein